MFDVIKKIIAYPRLTQDYPKNPVNSELFIGRPEIDTEKCSFCGECASRCPSGALVMDNTADCIRINLDACIFCALCEEVCQSGAVKMTNKFELAERDKSSLREGAAVIEEQSLPDTDVESLSAELRAKISKLFGRSLQIREVDAGSCNGCDYEINALNNPFNDVERLGISFVASPRHADMLLVTGAATRNMQLALQKVYGATPDPKLVVAVGACACSGGIFRNTYATGDGVDGLVPVDVYVPGCPPRPQAILFGILKALDRV
ncbi:MAG: NADH-quinone oxidoreductase subunit NuoB [Clostridia bacterium]|nr:NADH-quinone oxidoreductase subunit NuoB [Clostridia bacterium]